VRGGERDRIRTMTLRRVPKSKLAIQRARELRKAMTLPERALWRLLRDRRLANLKFRRQQPIGNYIADFFCESANLIVELDGVSHDGRAGYDRSRQGWFESRGLHVMRLSNDDVTRDPEAVTIGVAKAAGIDVDGRLKRGRNLVESPDTEDDGRIGSRDRTVAPPPHPSPLAEEREQIKTPRPLRDSSRAAGSGSRLRV
jgi:very-short-patch-repair endonuclease